MIYCLILFVFSFFFFDIKDVNTIDDVALIYDKKENTEEYFSVSFYDFNVLDLDRVFKGLNIKILSVKPYNYDKIYYDNTYKLIEEYNKKYLDNSFIVTTLKSFQIENMVIICTQSELSRLESRIGII